MNMSAELKERGLKILPNMTLCEKLQYLDLHSHHLGFGLEGSAQNWFGVVGKTFPGEKLISNEEDRGFPNPFADTDIFVVDLANLNSRTAKYISI